VSRRFPPRAALGLVALGGLAVLHDLLAIALDRAGLIERLLSPHDASALLAVAAALALYALRLSLVVVAPGVVVATLALWALQRHARALRAREVTTVRTVTTPACHQRT